MTTLVTIAIPCRNAGKWIAEAIASAFTQARIGVLEIEVVVVDDGSQDESRERVAAFGDLVRLIALQGGRGANVARNVALKEARGEWLQFLDADDYLLSGKIATQLAEAGEAVHDADVLYGPTYMETWRDGQEPQRSLLAIDTETSLVEQWISWQMPQTGGALWRRSSLARLGGWNETAPCCQEHELYLRAIQSGMKMVFTPTPGAVYRIWSEQTLCRRDPRLTISERSRLIESMLEWVAHGQGGWDAARQVAGLAFFEMSRTLAGIDLDEAVAYHDRYRRRGLIRLEGAAAPELYRIVCSLLGFRAAEMLARMTRKIRK